MKTRAFLQLHLSVFLFGFTAILGDLIQLNTISLVWWRVFFTVLFLVFIIHPLRITRSIRKKDIWRHVLIGVLVSIHWIAFYGSIKISNASIVLIAMSTTSFFTAMVEPMMLRSSKYKSFDLIISILVIPAMIMIYYNATEVQQTGLWIGLVASLVGAVFSVLNKMWLVENKEKEIIFIQQGTVWITLIILLLIFYSSGAISFEIPIGIDWFYLFVFAVLCTVIPYVLYLKAMKWLNAFDISFGFNMEPVYGMIMAALILKDYQELSLNIYLGMFFVIALVLIHTYLNARERKITE